MDNMMGDPDEAIKVMEEVNKHLKAAEGALKSLHHSNIRIHPKALNDISAYIHSILNNIKQNEKYKLAIKFRKELEWTLDKADWIDVLSPIGVDISTIRKIAIYLVKDVEEADETLRAILKHMRGLADHNIEEYSNNSSVNSTLRKTMTNNSRRNPKKSKNVREQEKLINAGCLPVGTNDGIIGRQTRAARKAFQKSEGKCD